MRWEKRRAGLYRMHRIKTFVHVSKNSLGWFFMVHSRKTGTLIDSGFTDTLRDAKIEAERTVFEYERGELI